MVEYEYRVALAQKYLRRGGSFLDLGCGAGINTLSFASLLDAIPFGIDVIDGNQCDIDFQVYDGHTIPFQDDYFSSMIVVHVLHHTQDADRVVQEISRVTKPGARVLIIEDMASSRLQNALTMLSDVYGNKLKNLVRALLGRRKFELTKVPMTYGIKSYPEWIEMFKSHKLELLTVQSIPHRLVEHGAFVFEKAS